jgi:hypothetical protein
MLRPRAPIDSGAKSEYELRLVVNYLLTALRQLYGNRTATAAFATRSRRVDSNSEPQRPRSMWCVTLRLQTAGLAIRQSRVAEYGSRASLHIRASSGGDRGLGIDKIL